MSREPATTPKRPEVMRGRGVWVPFCKGSDPSKKAPNRNYTSNNLLGQPPITERWLKTG